MLRQASDPPRQLAATCLTAAGCRRDHYTEKCYGQLFLPHAVYKFLSYLRRKGVIPAAEETAKCSVCQYRAAMCAAEGGPPVMWRQAEPCRCVAHTHRCPHTETPARW